MNNESIANAIRSRFKTQVADAIPLSTQYDNHDTDNPDETSWCRLTIKTGKAQQVSIGNPSAQRYRTPGVMIAQLFCPIGKGDSELKGLADSIIAAFRGVTDTGVTFRTPYMNEVGRKDADWQINVVCPFYADDIG